MVRVLTLEYRYHNIGTANHSRTFRGGGGQREQMLTQVSKIWAKLKFFGQ